MAAARRYASSSLPRWLRQFARPLCVVFVFVCVSSSAPSSALSSASTSWAMRQKVLWPPDDVIRRRQGRNDGAAAVRGRAAASGGRPGRPAPRRDARPCAIRYCQRPALLARRGREAGAAPGASAEQRHVELTHWVACLCPLRRDRQWAARATASSRRTKRSPASCFGTSRRGKWRRRSASASTRKDHSARRTVQRGRNGAALLERGI